ncbi:MAG: lanthionine synthetase LanC family protein, partial [Synechococcus sp.]
AALQGVAYENAHCDHATGHWLDLRQQQPSIMNSWCNGAPGIGLARLDMLKIEPNPTLLADLQKAIDLITTDQSSELDQLCCGVLGQTDLLLSAGCFYRRDDWINQAKQMANTSIQLAEKQGGFRLLKALPVHLWMPGLMQGEAGIAYQLLRLKKPNGLPSILALRTT